MPDDRPFRPQSRDRFGGDRPAPRTFGDRPAPRGERFGGERPGPRPGGFPPRPGGAPRPPFTPRPFAAAPAEGAASVRLRDGDREVEVHGPSAFCRQLLDDLPTLMARLRGEGRATAASVSLPPPPPPPARIALLEPVEQDIVEPEEVEADDQEAEILEEPEDLAPPRRGPGRPRKEAAGKRKQVAPRPVSTAGRQPAPNGAAANGGGGALEGLIHDVMRAAGSPIGIADLRRRLPEEVSGQALRRVLERDSKVVNMGGKPAAYRLR